MTHLTEKAEPEILKTDVLGRIWTPKEKRAELVAEYERSAMSAAEFAKWSGVRYATFTGWVQKARKERRKKAVSAVEGGSSGEVMRWAEAVCAEPPVAATAPLTIHLQGGIRVEAREGRAAAELLAALGVRAC